MKHLELRGRRSAIGVVLLLASASFAATAVTMTSPDPTGAVGTQSTTGSVTSSNPFFQSLGTNGRSCGTCHASDSGFGLSLAHVDAVYDSSNGSDPLFAAVDGANCPSATSTSRAAHSLLLQHGLIRVALAPPAGAEIAVRALSDPYGCAIENGVVSVYRRPLPSTNLRFLSAVMVDGRETVAPLDDASTFAANLEADLAHQAVDATLGHAQAASAPTSSQVKAIVAFELGLTTAQSRDEDAGRLDMAGATGGPAALSTQS